MFSGSPNTHSLITLPYEAVRRNTEYLKQLSCSGTIEQIVECARNKDRSSLISQKTSNDWFCSSNPFFTPVVDGQLLNDEPINLLKKGNFKNCSILTGVSILFLLENNKTNTNRLLFSYYSNVCFLRQLQVPVTVMFVTVEFSIICLGFRMLLR